MTGALTKAIPDHLQVVGPRFAGKTVLLHELATRLRQVGLTLYGSRSVGSWTSDPWD